MDDPAPDIRSLFTALLACQGREEQEALLAEVAARSPDQAERLRNLLAAHRRADTGPFLETHPRWSGHPTTPMDAPCLPPALEEGSWIGPYHLLQKLGEGGMGEVYMAEQDQPVRRRVALKIIKLGMDTREVVARFEAERQALALMDSPSIAKILGAGITDDGRPYFVMELVRGLPITTFCDKNRLSIRTRLNLFVQVCKAVQHAHQKGIIHRDLKPSNILVGWDGDTPHPTVIDFGIAKATNQRLTEKTLFTRFGLVVGTPSYMSPEQSEINVHDVDTRTDVYALGVLLYELLTGTTPFPEERLRAAGYAEIQRIIQEEEPARPSTLVSQGNQNVSERCRARGAEPEALSRAFRRDLDWIVLKALEKDRERRYDTAKGLALDVQRHLADEPVLARPPTFGYRLQKSWRRHRGTYVALTAVAASLVAGFSLSLWQAWVATQARNDAQAAGERESQLRAEAEQREREQLLISYASDMQAANRYLRENDHDRVRALLDRYVPGPGEQDLRGIYWHYLDRASRGGSLHTFPHETMVRSLSFSADGSRLATITMSGKAQLFDVATRAPQYEFGGGQMAYGARAGAVALSPDGRLLAAEDMGTLQVWLGENARRVFSQPRVTAPLAFSPDARLLVGGHQGGLTFWRTTDWTVAARIPASESIGVAQPTAVRFTPDNRRLIFSPSLFSERLLVYDLLAGQVTGELSEVAGTSAVTSDATRVAAGDRSGFIHVWDLASGTPIARFQAHNSIVLGLAFSPDGSLLASGGNERSIYLWETQQFTRVGVLDGHQNQIWGLATSSQARLLASASMDHSVKLWDWDRAIDLAATASSAAASSAGEASAPMAAGEPTEPAAPPAIHRVSTADALSAAVTRAAAGDTIQLAPGVYPLGQTLVVDKPLVIHGARGRLDDGRWPTRLTGDPGLTAALRVDTRSDAPTHIANLEIESYANVLHHASGNLDVDQCRFTTRSALDFVAVVSLEANAASHPDGRNDAVNLRRSQFEVAYVGDTPEGTPPDVDVILFASGARYRDIQITQCTITNAVPNGIANGIESRSTTAAIRLTGNRINCLGIAVALPNHRGSLMIQSNTICSATSAIGASTMAQEPGRIADNELIVHPRRIPVFPHFLQDYIAGRISFCVSLGGTSAGVTAGFFHQPFVGEASHFVIEGNVLRGTPDFGIALVDSPEPENFGPPTPNTSHDNTIIRNDFRDLRATWDVGLGQDTRDNRVYDNVGLDRLFLQAGTEDRNAVQPVR